MENNKLKEFIDEIIQEIEKDLDEATTSGAAGAYSTPGAFSDNGTKDKNKKKKIATQLGMKLVGKVNESETLIERQLKGLDGIDSKTHLSKASYQQKLKIIQGTGNNITFKVPKGSSRNFWQVFSKGKIKTKQNFADKKVYFLPGKIIGSPQYTSEKELVDNVLWDDMEEIRRFNESVVTEALTPIPKFKGHDNWTYIKLRTLFADINHPYFKTIDKVELGGTFIKVHYTMVNVINTPIKSGAGIPIEASERKAVVKFLSKILKQKYGFKGNFKKVNYKESVVKEASDDANFVVLYKNKGEKNTITRMRTTNTKAGGIKFLKDIEKKGGDGLVVKKADAVKLHLTTKKDWDVAKRKLGLKESVIDEAKKPQGPVNRWLAIKNDESKHPHKKMAMGLKELKYQLGETQKFFNWYNQIKSMNELDSSDYWKRTNKHIYKIKERLINIAKTIQEIEK